MILQGEAGVLPVRLECGVGYDLKRAPCWWSFSKFVADVRFELQVLYPRSIIPALPTMFCSYLENPLRSHHKLLVI